MAVLDVIAKIFGGSLLGGVKDLIGQFHLSPEKKAELQSIVDQNEFVLKQKQLEMEEKVQDAISNEITQAAEVIKAEANSQSWLPRNVRPLVLLMLSIPIAINAFVPIMARFWVPNLTPFPLDPWVYKLVAIGFTGYVTARTWEKVKDADN